MTIKIEGLSPKLEFVGEAEASDKPYRIELHWSHGKRFVLLHEDHPPRILRKEEIRERRERKPIQSDDDGA